MMGIVQIELLASFLPLRRSAMPENLHFLLVTSIANL